MKFWLKISVPAMCVAVHRLETHLSKNVLLLGIANILQIVVITCITTSAV